MACHYSKAHLCDMLSHVSCQLVVRVLFFKSGRSKYRYTRIVDDFDMPVRIFVNDQEKWLFPGNQWKTESLETDAPVIEIDRNFYIKSREIKS